MYQSLNCIVFRGTGLDFVGNLLHFCTAQRVNRQEEVLPYFQWNWAEAFRASHNGRWWNEWKASGKITSKCLPFSVKWKRRQTSTGWCRGGGGFLSSKQTLWPKVSEVFLWCCDIVTTVKAGANATADSVYKTLCRLCRKNLSTTNNNYMLGWNNIHTYVDCVDFSQMNNATCHLRVTPLTLNTQRVKCTSNGAHAPSGLCCQTGAPAIKRGGKCGFNFETYLNKLHQRLLPKAFVFGKYTKVLSVNWRRQSILMLKMLFLTFSGIKVTTQSILFQRSVVFFTLF